jgi:lipopolysaccharide biosynthesis protein
MLDVKTIAFHLPQFHPIDENNGWWGNGFTDWTNATKAMPLFSGHYQPHLPADLGFYDLRLPEARAAQAELASEYGIHGFCYYHYWFNGRRLLERPVDEILTSGEPVFPFCFCWANENWSRRWDGREHEILIEQNYSAEDDINHIRSLIPAFADSRYIRIGGKPLFLVYRSTALPDPRATTDRWRREVDRAGLPGLYLIRVESHGEQIDPIEHGFDAGLEFQPFSAAFWAARLHRFKWWHRRTLGTRQQLFQKNSVLSYPKLVKAAIELPKPRYPWIRSACPSWDNTARRKEGGVIIHGSTPELFETWVRALTMQIKSTQYQNGVERLLFINAWNEWAEGNHLEPCQRWGRAYLEALRRAINTSTPPEAQLARC